MSMRETPRNSGGTAIWYFVASTFLFSGSTFFGTSGDHRDAIAIVGIVAGFVVLAVGIVVFGREMRGNRG
jgi:hypothetical protein